MTTNALRSAVAAGACAAVVVLAGCNGDPEPTFADPSPTEPTTSATPDEPTPPELPDAAKERGKAGAKAFVAYFLDVINFAQATGDTELLATLGDKRCQPCGDGLTFIKNTYERGGSIKGGDLTLESPHTKPFDTVDQTGFQVEGEVRNTEQIVDLPGAKADEHYAASIVTSQFLVASKSGSWHVLFWNYK